MRSARLLSFLLAALLFAAAPLGTASAGIVRMIAERDVPTPNGVGDLILLTYPSLTDLLNHTNLLQSTLPLGSALLPEYSIHGLDIEPESASPVPEPSSGVLLVLGLLSMAVVSRARRRLVSQSGTADSETARTRR